MRRSVLLTVGILCSLGVITAHADGDLADALQQCSSIEDDTERLGCFDKLARRDGASDVGKPPREEVVGTGRWEVRSSEDSLGRGQSVSLILGASRIESPVDTQVFLVLRCVQGRPELFVDWGVSLGNDAFVTSTFGDEAPQTLVWDLAASGDSSFYPAKRIDSFVLQMVETDQYVAQAPIHGGETEVIAHFSPAGLGQALDQVREACGWSPTVVASDGKDGAPQLSAQDREYREQALAKFYDRCDVDPDGDAGQKAYADWTNLRGLGYTPKRIWQLSKKIRKSCRVQSFRDEIMSRGGP